MLKLYDILVDFMIKKIFLYKKIDVLEYTRLQNNGTAALGVYLNYIAVQKQEIIN